MKSIIVLLFLFVLSITSYSQEMSFGIGSTIPPPNRDLNYEVRGIYTHPYKKDKLTKVKSIRDIIPSYPSEWIMGNISVEIFATCGGKVNKALSSNINLTKEQKNIFTSADIGSDIVIDITYESKNPVTDNIESNKLHYSVTVVPEIEAVYLGGYQQLTEYIKENAIAKIPKSKSYQFPLTKVRFTVNEDGTIINTKLFQTSEDSAIDTLLLKVINNMPKWKPAENKKGINVKQEFELSVGITGC